MSRLTATTLLIAALTAPAPAAAGGMHRFVDGDGVVHLSNAPRAKGEGLTSEVGGCGITSAARCDGEASAAPPAEPAALRCPRALPYADVIRRAARAHGVDAALVAATIRVESNFDPRAVSAAGAQGLMQLMPGTAARMGVRDPFHPGDNVDGGARYLSELLAVYGGDEALALAAYNAGPPAVSAWGGLPPFPETQDFVARVQGFRACFEGVL